MISCRRLLFVAVILSSCLVLLADDKPAQNASAQNAPAPTKPAADAPKMSESTRMTMIRGLNAEMVYVRRPFPMGDKGVTIKEGVLSPTDEQLAQMIAGYGPALKTGDRARISNIRFKGDKLIVFEINGGPKKKTKWYEHIQVSGMGGSMTPTDPTADPTKEPNPRGTFVVLAFDKYVPEMSIQQVKDMLRPVFDFTAISAAQAYLDTLPPKVKDAIKNHQVLVGMNREMVTYSLGRPPKKYRDKDGEIEYEEWIYGEPPKDVQFVRFVGEEVVRLEIMKVDGEKLVRTEKEVEVKPTVAQQTKPENPDQPPAQPGAKKPSLRRPGEEAPPTPPGETSRTPLPGQTDPRQPLPPAGSPPPGTTPPPGQIPPE